METTNGTNEVTGVTNVTVIEAIVSDFTELTKLIEAENANFSEVKASKIAEIETQMQAVWLSEKTIEAKMAETSQLFDAKKHLELQTGVTLNSVLNNNAKYVMYNDTLFRFDTKQVNAVTMNKAKTLREASTKTASAVIEERFAAQPTAPLKIKHAGVDIPIGSYEHVKAQMTELGLSVSGLIAHKIIEQFPTFDPKKGVAGWSQVQFIQ